MALPVTDVQGTKLHLVATSVATSDATEIKAAIAGGKQIGCLQSIGDVTMTRAVQEYTCIDSDDSTKSQGSVSLGNQELSTLFDAADTAGQQELIAMWDTQGRRKLIIELNDEITPTTGNPTYIVYEVFVSNVSLPLAKDSAVMYNATVEITSLPLLTLAT